MYDFVPSCSCNSLLYKELLAIHHEAAHIPGIAETSAYRQPVRLPRSSVHWTMAAEISRAQQTTHGAAVEGARVALHRQLVDVAEQHLGRAIAEQVRPPLGMYAHPSTAEAQAFDVAVREICREALRLDLRAEELLIGIKQAWCQLASMRARHLGDRDGDVLRAVVSGSIEVFFEAREHRALDG